MRATMLYGRSHHIRTQHAGFGGFISALGAWIERQHQRAQLRDLPDEVLKDIGVTRADAEREASKPFWQA
ncbi:MAG TPA: DUF1127 domain-containing protein [Azospirillaceae bacterium]|nr:DUF1127 domain-containing protein [Azospirillaceae bacterium]